MKIENSWVNLTLVKIEAGNDRVMALKESFTGKVFRTDNDVNELDQIVLPGDGEYYICFEINKEIHYTDERQPEYEIKYISLNDYYIYHFHSILDNEYLSWQEKPEMVRDLSNDVFELFNKCKYICF
jgi:hypothetical protein